MQLFEHGGGVVERTFRFRRAQRVFVLIDSGDQPIRCRSPGLPGS